MLTLMLNRGENKLIKILEDLESINESDAIFKLQQDNEGYRLFMSEKSQYYKAFLKELQSDKNYKEFVSDNEAREFIKEFEKEYNITTRLETC